MGHNILRHLADFEMASHDLITRPLCLLLCSLLHRLRGSVHFELAKILADQDRTQSALEHLDKVPGVGYVGGRGKERRREEQAAF